MKKIIPLVGILLITSIFFGCGKTGNLSNRSWKITSESEAIFPRNIGGFFNKKYGVTVGYAGEIYYTKDKGKTWNKGSNSSYCLFGLCIVNTKVAYACGNGTYVVKTTDGAKNWKQIMNFGEYEPNQPRYLSFINEDMGWIATPQKFKHKDKIVMLGSTKDGGETWEYIVLPEEIDEIVAIYLRTAENGYILDNKNNLYITNDGGKNFVKQPLNIEDACLNAKAEPHVVLKFSDENYGFIAYENEKGKFQAARSSDGGKTWINDTVPDLPNGALYLSQDGKTITLTRPSEFIKVLEYK